MKKKMKDKRAKELSEYCKARLNQAVDNAEDGDLHKTVIASFWAVVALKASKRAKQAN